MVQTTNYDSPQDNSHNLKRKMTWSAGDNIPPYPQPHQSHQETHFSPNHLELYEEDEQMALPGGKRDRRRVQNRLAQRAYRAKSKITRKEVRPYMYPSIIILKLTSSF